MVACNQMVCHCGVCFYLYTIVYCPYGTVYNSNGAAYCSESFIGEVLPDRNRDNKHVLFTHKSLVINYNGNQVGLKERIFTM